MKTRLLGLALLVTVVLAVSIPVRLGITYVPLGDGLDEFSHFDNIVFRYLHPQQELDTNLGLLAPGKAPLGQGHQPPLYYELGAVLLSYILPQNKVGGFIDYQAGVQYSSQGLTFGGRDWCPYRTDVTRNDERTKLFRNALSILRAVNGVLFGITILFAFATGYLCYPNRPLFALAIALFTASIPNALWRSIYVNNDNLVALFSNAAFLYGCYIIAGAYRSKRPVSLMDATILALLSALSFLSKYNGVVAIGISTLSIFIGIYLTGPSCRHIIKNLVQKYLCLLILFVSLIFYDLYVNYKVDGNLLSFETVIHSTSFLYRPSSFFSILFDKEFVTTALNRFWVEFHAIAIHDETFPNWAVYIWPWLLFISVIGFASQLFRKNHEEAIPLILGLYSLLCALASLFFLVQMGTSFPLPGGRYLHVSLLPFVLFVVLGITLLLDSLPRAGHAFMPTRIVSILCGFSFITFGGLTYFHIKYRFINCRHATSYNVDSGGTFAAGDLDRDGDDDLLFFHRQRTRMFFAENRGGKFLVRNDWTRSTGVIANRLMAGDIDGDSSVDPVFWQPSNGIWSYVFGYSIVNFDSTVSKYSDLAVRYNGLSFRSRANDRPFVADADHDGKADLIFYRPGKGAWFVNNSPLLARQRPFESNHLLGKKGRPVVIPFYNQSFLGAYFGDEKLLKFYDFNKPGDEFEISGLPITPTLVEDFDRDGSPEFLLWRKHQPCFELYKLLERPFHLESRTRRRYSVAPPTPLCLSIDGQQLAVSQHFEFLPISLNRDQRGLALFSKLTGNVYYSTIQLSSAEKPNDIRLSRFNPGWSSNHYLDHGMASLP